MKVIIDIKTEVKKEMVFEYFRQKCIEGFQNFEISMEGTELKHKEVKK